MGYPSPASPISASASKASSSRIRCKNPVESPCVAPADVESSESTESEKTAHSPFVQGGNCLQPLLPFPQQTPPPRRRLVQALFLIVRLGKVNDLEELPVIFGAQAELIQEVRIGSSVPHPFDQVVA